MTAEIRGYTRSDRIAGLYASDPRLQAARPSQAVVDAARQPGIRLAELLRTFMDGYADRPALGMRASRWSTTRRPGDLSGDCCPSSRPSPMASCGPT